MLSLVTAAEQQYRHETAARDREFALIAAIRERRAAEAAAAPTTVHPAPPASTRPLAARLAPAEVCTTACAVA